MAATSPKMFLNTPLKIKLQSILRGLRLYLPLGVWKLQVESDYFLAKVLQEGAYLFFFLMKKVVLHSNYFKTSLQYFLSNQLI